MNTCMLRAGVNTCMLRAGVNTCMLTEHAQRIGVNTWCAMATSCTQVTEKSRMAAVQLSSRLKKCWSVDINWDLYPTYIREVRIENKYCYKILSRILTCRGVPRLLRQLACHLVLLC